MATERMTDERLEEIRVLARQHDEYIQREFPSRPPVVTPLAALLAEIDRLRAAYETPPVQATSTIDLGANARTP